MIKKLIIVTLILTLIGCTGSKSSSLRVQINNLNSRLNIAENQLQVLQQEIAAVKKQRIVRLPTGAPIIIQKRSEQQPGYITLEKQQLFNSAIADYKAGNTKLAIDKFQQFNNKYPKDENHDQVLYYLGKSHYSIQNYEKAQQILEKLIYKTKSGQDNNEAFILLQRIYNLLGETNKLNQLKNFKKHIKIRNYNQ